MERDRRDPDAVRAQVWEIKQQVDKMASDLGWLIALSKWGIGIAIMALGGSITMFTSIHNSVDDNFGKIDQHEARITNLESSRQKRIERSRQDHLNANCHFK